MQEAKKLLYKNNFKIVEQNQGGRYDPICGAKKRCIINGNHEYDYIIFKDKKTGVQLELAFFENNLYTVSFPDAI